MIRRKALLTLLALSWCVRFAGVGFGEAAELRHYRYASRNVAYEQLDGEPHGPIAILLPGTSGPAVPYYQERAKALQNAGFTVLILHYFDATKSQAPAAANYEAWVGAVQGLLSECKGDPKLAHRRIALVCYSLGASIALAAGSQAVPVDAIAEWYGSLPDLFFQKRKGMPPQLILHGREDTNIPAMNAEQLIKLCALDKLTCESHIYPTQAHGFTGGDLADADSRTIAFLREQLEK